MNLLLIFRLAVGGVILSGLGLGVVATLACIGGTRDRRAYGIDYEADAFEKEASDA